MRLHVLLSVPLCLAVAGFMAQSAAAQQPPPFGQSQGAPSKSQTKSKGPAAPAGTTDPAATTAKGGSDNPLRSRVEQLEEQLVDLQVTIGTLESLARTTGSGATSGASSQSYRPPGPISSGGGDQAGTASRVDGLEIQLRALVGQVEQLSDQVRALNGRRSAGPETGDSRIAAAVPPPIRPAGPSTGFGSTTVVPGSGIGGDDQIGKIIGEDTSRPMPAAIPGGDAGNPKQSYETAYGYLLQQNYGAAETAFDEFLVRHPNDALAGNAQYWLGESFFVRGQFKQAAGAFLKGYQTYARSAKAPDSLLKLAMSLDRLGQKEAACTSYNELNTRFPAASQTIKARADSERRRIGC